MFRLTASLQGGETAAPPAQVFQLSQPAELEIVFPFLRQDKDYGRLCILEEPLASGFTAMGRQISGVALFNCYFSEFSTVSPVLYFNAFDFRKPEDQRL